MVGILPLMPRARNEGNAPGWPKNKPRGKVSSPGEMLASIGQDVDQRLGASIPQHHLWQQLTPDQKRFVIRLSVNQGHVANACRDIGKRVQWYYAQRNRSRSGLIFREITEDVFLLQQTIEGHLVGEIIFQTLQQTVSDLLSEDPSVKKVARKEGWDLIRTRLRPTQQAPQPQEQAKTVFFTPRKVTKAEEEQYASRGVPGTVDSEVLERDDS
tara:strand:- start:3141 stop:3779 length:639 start_codon:yes stop_codon:yes gene_type:complete